jgi:hypothetical protein
MLKRLSGQGLSSLGIALKIVIVLVLVLVLGFFS